MLSLPHRRDFPLRYEGGFEHGMGRKSWICEACLDALLSRWLQWCSAGRFGLRVFAISGRSVLVVALAPPVSAWLRLPPQQCSPGTSPFTWVPGPLLSQHLRHFLLMVCVTKGSPGVLQSSQDTQGPVLGFDLCRCTGRGTWEFLSEIQHGSETKLGVSVCDY